MKPYFIKCNDDGVIMITPEYRENGLVVILNDNGKFRIAEYKFGGNQLEKVDKIEYVTNNVRAQFKSSNPIIPSFISEIIPSPIN